MSDNRRYTLLIIIGLVLVTAGLLLMSRCARPDPPVVTPAPPTVTATATHVATIVVTETPESTKISQITPVHTPTATPTTRPTIAPTIVVTPTPDLKGYHLVRRGETMYGIALLWEPGRYFAYGRDVWEPVCRVNPQIANCRLIYPGDVLGIPQR